MHILFSILKWIIEWKIKLGFIIKQKTIDSLIYNKEMMDNWIYNKKEWIIEWCSIEQEWKDNWMDENDYILNGWLRYLNELWMMNKKM